MFRSLHPLGGIMSLMLMLTQYIVTTTELISPGNNTSARLRLFSYAEITRKQFICSILVRSARSILADTPDILTV